MKNIEIFDRTLLHPILKEKIEFVPTKWLYKLGNPFPKTKTDLGNWGNNQRVTLDELYNHITEHGMRDPLIVGIGRVDRKIRLETGNQRVQCFISRNIEYVPAVGYLGDSCVTNTGNGLHEGIEVALKIPEQVDIMGPYPSKEYCKLSDILVHFPV